MRRSWYVFFVATFAVSLYGCETYQILTFSAHPNSGVAKSTTSIELLSKQVLPKGQTRDVKADTDYGLCASTVGPNIAPLLLPVISGVATLLLDSGTQAISGWADKKKKEFSTSASVSANQDALLQKRPDGFHLAFDCIVIKQYPGGVAGAGVASDPILVFAGSLIASNDQTAFKLVPTYVKFAKATAKTDSKTGKVDLEVKIEFSVITSGKLSQLGTADIRLPSLELPAESQGAKEHALVQDSQDPVLLHTESAWIPLANADALLKECTSNSTCISIEPTTVVATLTETGTGSDAFGQLSTDASNSTKTLEGLISQALQGKSGSSNSSNNAKK